MFGNIFYLFLTPGEVKLVAVPGGLGRIVTSHRHNAVYPASSWLIRFGVIMITLASLLFFHLCVSVSVVS